VRREDERRLAAAERAVRVAARAGSTGTCRPCCSRAGAPRYEARYLDGAEAALSEGIERSRALGAAPWEAFAHEWLSNVAAESVPSMSVELPHTQAENFPSSVRMGCAWS
jgi:hypothetical protein